MAEIKAKIERLKRLHDNVDRYIDESIKEREKDILTMNKDQLYKDGSIDVTQPTKRERYSPATIVQKRKSAAFKEVGHVTLRWTGDLYDSFKLIIFKDKILISATDTKWNYLGENPRFKNALGLVEDNIRVLRDMVHDGFIKRFKNAV